jgi:hypothetical protein
MCATESEACRRCVAESLRIRPEVDPAKAEHVALIFDLAAVFTHSLAKIVARVFSSYLQPNNWDELSDALLTFLYGGRENYEHLNSLRKMITSSQPANGRPLTLPEWDRFLQLVRHGLDAPTELPYAALLLRELGWGFLGGTTKSAFAIAITSEKRQASKMALLAFEYIAQAGRLPPEFAVNATKLLLDLQQPPINISRPLAKE